MKHAILHAKPSTLAIAGAAPFAIAMLAFSTEPLGGVRLILFNAAIFTGVSLVLLWAWIVGHALIARIDDARTPNVTLFRVAIAFCASYAACFLFATANAGFGFLPHYPFVAFGLHLLATAAMLNILHFIGTNLARAEETVDLSPGSPWTTTLVLSSIAGILPVQKRINRVFDASSAGARA